MNDLTFYNALYICLYCDGILGTVGRMTPSSSSRRSIKADAKFYALGVL